ncbi:hypothetical protein TNIN_18291 [Trichonephila inaurata madagascariensis]|uniref:Uncharacterized protein n=1 Tax=Trichonephila inaurata madagascariensis TaxID=2747483 RepID=A0A8X7BXB7_9ARAC|nr:hypothetical protein TNIN_18291 [Trichonephila inaurata madagascariensis]
MGNIFNYVTIQSIITNSFLRILRVFTGSTMGSMMVRAVGCITWRERAKLTYRQMMIAGVALQQASEVEHVGIFRVEVSVSLERVEGIIRSLYQNGVPLDIVR